MGESVTVIIVFVTEAALHQMEMKIVIWRVTAVTESAEAPID